MTHPLLTPRYMVEADYPNSPFKVGDVLTVEDAGTYEFVRSGHLVILRDTLDKCHKIFRKMHWSEGRELSEMPRYLRFVDNPEYVVQVDLYLLGKVLFIEHTAWEPIEWYTPATEAEYLEYLKSKEK